MLPVRDYFMDLQDRIVAALEAIDGRARFLREEVPGPEGTLSRPRVLEDGAEIEKAAVQFTHSRGASLPPAATERNPELAGQGFQAAAISLIVHPRNPYAPTTHANLRFFLVEAETPVWYFGGGFDLTPYYGFDEDAVHWHTDGPGCGWRTLSGTEGWPATSTSICRTDRSAAVSADCSSTTGPRAGSSCVCVHALDRRSLPPRLRADRPAPDRHVLRRTRARLATLPAGSLRGVQPGDRSRYQVRASEWPSRRVGVGVAAAAREVEIQLPAGTGFGGSAPVHRLSAAPEMGLICTAACG
jgi:hypothetical protein